MENKLKNLIADILECSPDEITDQTCVENSENWDSLTHIELISSIEREFNITLKTEEMIAMVSFPKILDLLENKLHKTV